MPTSNVGNSKGNSEENVKNFSKLEAATFNSIRKILPDHVIVNICRNIKYQYRSRQISPTVTVLHMLLAAIWPEDSFNASWQVLWNTAATTQTIVADSARTYIVDVWKNGCRGGDTINVNFFPAAPIVNLGNDTMICSGTSFVLDASVSGATYLWHDNSTAATYVADTIGNYSVTVTDVNTCNNTDDINVSAVISLHTLTYTPDTCKMIHAMCWR